jgi:hypothetical protein
VAAALRYGHAVRDERSEVRVPTDGLRELLGSAPPDGVAALPDADRQELSEVIASALRRQDEQLAASFEATLRHVPLPLRPLVRRVLLG